ncbi:MAG: hypothetical protein KAT90_10305 [Gammaproteobacteria bacterium]|nr:hypothetical protein [Gammaproteobacteria bacterium]
MATVKAVSKYKRYEDNQKARGFVKVHIWCPKGDQEAVKKYAEKKRKAHLKKK